MHSGYTGEMAQDERRWVGKIEETPGMSSQGTSRGRLMENLRPALAEMLEVNRDAARKAARGEFEEVFLLA